MELAIFLTHISFLFLAFSGMESTLRLYFVILSFYSILFCISIEYIFLLIDFIKSAGEFIHLKCKETKINKTHSISKGKKSDIDTKKIEMKRRGFMQKEEIKKNPYNDSAMNYSQDRMLKVPKSVNNTGQKERSHHETNLKKFKDYETTSDNFQQVKEEKKLEENIIPSVINVFDKVPLPNQAYTPSSILNENSKQKYLSSFKEVKKYNPYQKIEDADQVNLAIFLTTKKYNNDEIVDYFMRHREIPTELVKDYMKRFENKL